MNAVEILEKVFQMADDEVQQLGDNEHRYRALKRIRAFAVQQLEAAKAEVK